MAGLIEENFEFEVMTELSWIKRVLMEICDKLEIDTYESNLIKYCVEPEEEAFLSQMMKYRESFLHLSYDEIREEFAVKFEKEYNKPFTLSVDVLEKLIKRFLHLLNHGYSISYQEQIVVK